MVHSARKEPLCRLRTEKALIRLFSRRKYFMINLHERMLSDLVGIEPATSWSPGGRATDWAIEVDHASCNLIWYIHGNYDNALTLTSLQTCTDTFANSADPDKTARYEPSHQDQHCLPFCFFFFFFLFFFYLFLFLFSCCCFFFFFFYF